MIRDLGSAFLDGALDWLNSKVLGLAAFLIGVVNDHVITFLKIVL